MSWLKSILVTTGVIGAGGIVAWACSAGETCHNVVPQAPVAPPPPPPEPLPAPPRVPAPTRPARASGAPPRVVHRVSEADLAQYADANPAAGFDWGKLRNVAKEAAVAAQIIKAPAPAPVPAPVEPMVTPAVTEAPAPAPVATPAPEPASAPVATPVVVLPSKAVVAKVTAILKQKLIPFDGVRLDEGRITVLTSQTAAAEAALPATIDEISIFAEGA
jgi:hypothetical protein